MKNGVRKGSEKTTPTKMLKNTKIVPKVTPKRSRKADLFSKKTNQKWNMGPNLAPRWCPEGPKTLQTSILNDF